MPLIHGYSDATRSKNIKKLRREGYSSKQASAIAYRVQRQELRKHHMSTRKLAKRSRDKPRARRRKEAKENPSPAMDTAIKWLGGGALVGGALGAFVGIGAGPTNNTIASAMGGAASAVGLVAIGGLVYGLVEPKDRDAAFATAGLGLAGSILLGVITNMRGI